MALEAMVDSDKDPKAVPGSIGRHNNLLVKERQAYSKIPP
jgi:hypothetical protein